MRVFAMKISSMVTALGLLTGTATALTDTHTIGVLAYQGEAERSHARSQPLKFIGPTGSKPPNPEVHH